MRPSFSRFFPIIIMYILNITKAIKNMTIKELKDFIFENYYRQNRFINKKQLLVSETLKKTDLLSFATNLIKTIPDPSNTK